MSLPVAVRAGCGFSPPLMGVGVGWICCSKTKLGIVHYKWEGFWGTSLPLSLSLPLLLFLRLSFFLYMTVGVSVKNCVCVHACVCLFVFVSVCVYLYVHNGFLSFAEHSGHSLSDSTWSLLCQTECVSVETYQANVCPPLALCTHQQTRIHFHMQSSDLCHAASFTSLLPVCPHVLWSFVTVSWVCFFFVTKGLKRSLSRFNTNTRTHTHNTLVLMLFRCGRKDNIACCRDAIASYCR